MKKALGTSLAATVLALGMAATAFGQGKGVSDSKGGPFKGMDEEVRTVPEPGTLALLGLAIGGLVYFVRRGKK